MDQPSSSHASLPEKPAAAQVNAEQYHHHPPGQPQQFQAVEMPKPERFRPTKVFSMGKLTLACFNFVFALIVLGLSIAILTISFDDAIGLIIAAALAVASLIWQIAEFITLAARRSIHRPIHPGAHIGVHLILTVLALVVALSCCVSVSYIVGAYSIDSECNSSSRSGSQGYSNPYDCDYYDFTDNAAARRYITMLEALTAFVIFMTVAHLVLFVLACVEAHRRRKWGRKTKVVYLVAAPAADGRIYYSHVPSEKRGAAAGAGGVAGGSADPGLRGYFAPPAPAAGGVAGPDPGPQGYYAPPPPAAAAPPAGRA